MNLVWTRYLVHTFGECRNSPGWEDIYRCHDEEDRDYFAMLEDEAERGRLALKEW